MNAPWKSGLPGNRDPFAAYICDDNALDVIRPVVIELGWQPEKCNKGGLRNGVQSLSVSASPAILMVDLSECGDPLNDINALADVCDVGSYCLDLGDTTPLLGCAPSLCDVDMDCGTGTCVRFDNDFGLCFTAGAATEGATCSNTTRCPQGLFCDYPSSAATSGVCRELCDPFTTGACGAGQFCGEFISAAQGLCDSNQTTLGTDPFETCQSAGDWCADSVQCASFGSFNACLAYCRAGGTDCDGLLSNGGNAVCDNYVFPGNRLLGECYPPCDPTDADPCGPGAVCVDTGVDAGKCRFTCTAGSVTADCCGGTTPCNFECINGLCE